MATQPHIVLMMADQLRWDCLYGDLGVQTPNLDLLAEEAIVFDRVYCATPLCTPTRSSMFTGKWPHTHGAIVNGHAYEPEKPYGTVGPKHRTVYEVLSEGGYGLTHVGVQHCRLDPVLEARVPEMEMVTNREYAAYARSQNVRKNPLTQDLRVWMSSTIWRPIRGRWTRSCNDPNTGIYGASCASAW